MSGTPGDCLILGGAEIARLIDPAALQEALGLALRAPTASAPVHASFRQVLPVPNGDAHVVGGTATVNGLALLGVKINGRYHSGAVRGSLLLVDASTGVALGLLDSAAVTVARTAAMVAVVVRELAPRRSRRALIVGAGRLAHPVLTSLQGLDLFEEFGLWSRRPEQARALTEVVADPRVRAVVDLHEASTGADVIACITSSAEPLLSASSVHPGALVVATGADAPHKREIASALMASSAVIVDSVEQCLQHGELGGAVRDGSMSVGGVRGTVAEVFQGAAVPRRHPDESVIVDLTGIALQDVVAGALVCAAARRDGIGTTVPVDPAVS